MFSLIPQPKKIFYTGGRLSSLPPIDLKKDAGLPDDGSYNIEIAGSRCAITAGGETGFRLAGVTLDQLDAARRGFPRCTIEDSPTYGYRGVMFDCSRHFIPVDELKKLLSSAAFFKYNYFHWHLSDDQGWRIESRLFPELTQIGSVRPFSKFGSVYEPGEYGGFYTREQIGDVVSFCAGLNMTVVPEIDMPGHCSALLAAHPELSCAKTPVAVKTRGGIFGDILCAGDNSVFDFLEKLLGETAELFPGEYFHIGGDETPKTAWKACPACRERIRSEGLRDEEELQGYFTRRAAEIVRSLGKKPIVWNDAVNCCPLPPDITVQYWMGKPENTAAHAERGGKVIMSDFYHCYTDYSYGQTPLSKCLSYDPAPRVFNEAQAKNIIGIETPLWGEYVRDIGRAGYQFYPRAAALAETAWNGGPASPAAREGFADAFRALSPRLVSLGVTPAPEADWDPGVLGRAGRLLSFWRRNFAPETIGDFLKLKKE